MSYFCNWTVDLDPAEYYELYVLRDTEYKDELFIE